VAVSGSKRPPEQACSVCLQRCAPLGHAWVSSDAFYDELRRTADETEAALRDSSAWKGPREDEIRQDAERWTRSRYGRPYWYNEMIGVIRISQDGGSIKGQFWETPPAGLPT